VTGPVARYTSSRWYAPLALCAFGCLVGAVWIALRWPPEAAHAGFVGKIAAVAGIVILGILAIGLAALAVQPAIEIHETHLVMTGAMEGAVMGRRAIPWHQIRRVDQGRWQTHGWQIRRKVLVVILTLDGGDRLWVVHAGGFDSGRSLMRHLRLCSREALLDGIPYRQFWGQGASEQPRAEHARPEQARSEYARPEGENPERGNLERNAVRSRAGDPPVPFKYPLLLAEDEAEIEHMFQRLKSVGRLDPQSHEAPDTGGDASLDSRASGEGQG
jgi:hypothetical protein